MFNASSGGAFISGQDLSNLLKLYLIGLTIIVCSSYRHLCQVIIQHQLTV